MIQEDTVKLLRECDAGIQIGVASITDVIGHVNDSDFRLALSRCKNEHETLQSEVESLLDQYHDSGKAPSPMAKGMSWMKSNWKIVMDRSDSTIADLMTDGCNMGVKTLNHCLNQYQAADEVSKDIAKRLIHLEQRLAADIRQYL